MSEVETALIILSRDRNQVNIAIRELILNKGYEVEEKGIQKIKDVYLDRKNDILKKEKIALRIRLINDQIFKITLKISKTTQNKYFERIEIEHNWSQESLNKVIFELSSYVNLDIYNTPTKYYKNNPIETLLDVGFKIIQNKETHRVIINAINKKSNQIEFEFAKDTTSFIMNDGVKIRYLELEIESKKIGNEKFLEKFIQEFTLLDSLFELWPYSKLETGIAIKYFYDHNNLIKNTDYDENNMLTLSGFEKIRLFCHNNNI